MPRSPLAVPRRALALASTLALALPLVACGGASSTGSGASAPSRGTAYDFALDDIKGQRFQLSEHLGKEVILLDFWATWCDPCKAEIPHLARIYQDNKDKGLLVLGISIDGPESLAQVRGDVEQLRIPFPVLLDTESRVVAQYNPRRSAPFSVLIDRKGNIVSVHDAYVAGDEVTIAKEIEAELAKP